MKGWSRNSLSLRMSLSGFRSRRFLQPPRHGPNTDGEEVPYPNEPPRRGEIYWVDFDPARGSEQAGHRPAVVVSIDSFNRAMPTVVVAAITSKIKPAMKITVLLPQGNPLPQESQILAFQVLTIDKARLGRYAGTLSAAQTSDLEASLRLCWGL